MGPSYDIFTLHDPPISTRFQGPFGPSVNQGLERQLSKLTLGMGQHETLKNTPSLSPETAEPWEGHCFNHTVQRSDVRLRAGDLT